jgi:hypothetical protein
MINPIALLIETCGVSTQKSAEGIVVPGNRNEGPNVEMSGASNELDVGVESDRMSQASARHGIAFPRSGLNVSVVYIVDRDLIRLRPDDFCETPTADPHGGCCGGWGLTTPGYLIMRSFIVFVDFHGEQFSNCRTHHLAILSLQCF